MFRKVIKYFFIFVVFVVILDPFLRYKAGSDYDRVLLKLRQVVERAWQGHKNTAYARIPANQSFKLVIPEDLDVTNSRKKIVSKVKSLVGTNYQLGGESRLGVDCSGLVVLAYRQIGIELPHKATKQYRVTRHLKYDDIQSGDLVFFRSNSKTVGHVGIFVGKGLVVHASSTRQRVVVDPLYVVAMNNKVVGLGSVFHD